MTPIASLHNATVGYPDAPLMTDFSFSLYPGEFVALVGPNGSGKTTIMKSLLGVLPLIAGSREMLGLTNPANSELAGQIAYIPQKMSLNRSVPLTVGEFFSLKSRGRYDHEDLARALKMVELTGLQNQSIHQLSGGQLQRVFMGFALLGKPKLICLDEATEGMDIKAQKTFYALLKNIVEQNRASLLLISHDISAVTEHANRVVCINRTILYDGDPSSPQFHSCLHRIYGEDSHIHDHRTSH
ncbi:MAG TPA: metal ABC transporter ATP-binding protein [Bdellovibrionales bacterium]|nr:metal ABC transporter ATP-binding protein [Bdellovibrionales bacterium]